VRDLGRDGLLEIFMIKYTVVDQNT